MTMMFSYGYDLLKLKECVEPNTVPEKEASLYGDSPIQSLKAIERSRRHRLGIWVPAFTYCCAFHTISLLPFNKSFVL